jgi:hypothetical protein
VRFSDLYSYQAKDVEKDKITKIKKDGRRKEEDESDKSEEEE